MIVVIAEKPSVAIALASFLGARSRRDGYLEGNGYQVTWAFGHLVGLKEPEDYEPALKRWSLETLPFVPDRFELKARGDKQAQQQFKTIKRLFRSANELICATDAGREGELIFRYILAMTGCENKTTKRLWLKSLTEQAIREAFRSLRPISDFDNLYSAARCRSEADWIVGLNATRNYTVRYRSSGILWSVGRVQTPVLAMIVRRDDEIRTFRPETFWELMTKYRKTDFRFTGERFTKQQEAQSLLERVRGHDFVVREVISKPEKLLPPQLYDLTELQRDMNRRFGMTAADTLQIAQSLYEKKLITYPRTDSRYLSADMKKEVPEIMRQLRSAHPDAIGQLNLAELPFTSRIVNNRKVSDHHAILPTGAAPESLSARDQKIYDAIVTRFIAAFYPPCLKEVTTVEGVSNAVPFRARGVRITSPGWTELYPRKPGDKRPGNEDELNEDEQSLPVFSPGERGPHQPAIKQGETSPPKHFTENTLLGAMETAGKLVDDAELRDALKEKGLGTPATRASIIETLLKRNYVSRQKKNLLATDLGRYLIALIQDENLKSPELTGEWEAKLKSIEGGKLSSQQFMQEIVAYTRQIIQASDITRIDQDRFGNCPKCGREVIKGNRGFGCSGWRDGCSFVLWPTYEDHELDMDQVRSLLQHRISNRPITMGGSSQAVLTLLDTGELAAVPVPDSKPPTAGKMSKRNRTGKRTGRQGPPAPTKRTNGSSGIGKCPLCGAEVVEQKRSFGCSKWQSGCPFTIWKTMAGKRINARTAKTLLRDGRTSRLKGFQSKSGKAFDASLKLDGGVVQFDFES